MVYSLTLHEDEYSTLLATLPDLARAAKPIRDPSLATTKQCWYIASLATADRGDKRSKRIAQSVLYKSLCADPSFTLETAMEAIDNLKAGIPWQHLEPAVKPVTVVKEDTVITLTEAINRVEAWEDTAAIMARSLPDTEAEPYRNQVCNYAVVSRAMRHAHDLLSAIANAEVDDPAQLVALWQGCARITLRQS